MKNTVTLTLTLTIIAAISAVSVSYVNQITAEPIRQQQIQREQSALAAVLPAGDSTYTDTLRRPADTLPFWVSYEQGIIQGYALKATTAKGYSSTIDYLIGLDAAGNIHGLSILSQGETPGLGARITEIASDITLWGRIFKGHTVDTGAEPWFCRQFSGLQPEQAISINKTIGEWPDLDSAGKVALQRSNEITAVSGATITTRTVKKSIETDIADALGAIERKIDDK
ncbi:MAG: FMN-binding protein [Fibrobacterota bacterium]